MVIPDGTAKEMMDSVIGMPLAKFSLMIVRVTYQVQGAGDQNEEMKDERQHLLKKKMSSRAKVRVPRAQRNQVIGDGWNTFALVGMGI